MIKKRYLFLIMLVCLFAISAVSAEEIDNSTNDIFVNNADNEINDIDNEKLSLNPDDEFLERQVPYEVGKIKFWNNETQTYEFEQNNPYVSFSQEGENNEIISFKITSNFEEYNVTKSEGLLRIMELGTTNVVKTLSLSELNMNQISKINVGDLNLGNYKLELYGYIIEEVDGEFLIYIIPLAEGIFFVSTNLYIDVPDVNKYYHGSERFTATLTKNNGKPITNVDVRISINGNTYTKTTDSNGQVSMALNLNSGEYDVKTECDDIEYKSKVIIKDTVDAKDFTKVFRNGTQYSGTFYDSEGNLLRNTDIDININGVWYTRKTDNSGIARMNINLNPGEYILTATNPVTGEKHTTQINVLPNIIGGKDLRKFYRNDSQYVVQIIGDDGKPVGSGVSVSFNINGVFYTRTTDSNGYAKMNINLRPGEYIITGEYKGYRTSNKISVLPILSSNDLYMYYRDGSKFEVKLLDGQGRMFPNQKVEFNINGVFYTRTTDNDGVARLNINLLPGDYIITSSYNGLSISNEIHISGEEIFYIDLPLEDEVKISVEKGKYIVEVDEWRIPPHTELDIILFDLNGQIISKFDYDTYYYYKGIWYDMPVNEMGGNYHKESFPPDTYITKVAVKLKNALWY